MAWAGELAQKPAGWAYADGDALDCAAYSDLCAALDSGGSGTWGGTTSGSSFFNLPDLRGYVLRGLDANHSVDPDCSSRSSGSNVNNNTVGGRTDCVVGSYQNDATALPDNSFVVQDGEHFHDIETTGSTLSNNSSKVQQGGDNFKGTSQTAGGEHSHNITGGDDETRMKNAAVHYIISCGNKSDQQCAYGRY